MVVSSAIYHPFLESTLERFGILDAFEMVITSASCGYYKSRQEIYHHALDALGIAPGELVHVGDSLKYDVTTAGRLGVRTVWLNADADGEHGADMRLPHFAVLAPALLATWMKPVGAYGYTPAPAGARLRTCALSDRQRTFPDVRLRARAYSHTPLRLGYQKSTLMRVDVFTIFPGIFDGPLDESIVRRAIERGLLEIALHDIREHGVGRHRAVDDTPYGGGAGMVMAAPPIFASVKAALGTDLPNVPIIYMSASGERFTQSIAAELSQLPRVALLCGRYEGIDQRVRDQLVTREISIGDYVLTGGELAAAVIIDAITRLLPGAIDAASLEEESHTSGLLEYPHYTRPADFRGWGVPDVLLSGHHAEIARWRAQRARELTRQRRPDLLRDEPEDSPVLD